MDKNKIKATQEFIFDNVAKMLRDKYPHKSLRIEYPSDLIIEDLDTLQKEGKLKWKASVKSGTLLNIEQEHPIKLVVYYRGEPVGYAFGGYKKKLESLEISWIEKRVDAHADLDHQMLGLTIDSYAAYGMMLRKNGLPVKQLAIVSPVEDAKRYYKECGFDYTASYDGYTEAMIFKYQQA
ncbi:MULTISPECIES: hypothetical protein [Proteus]|uniref:hypothetical protein n=1 Tax=Proteus TaxID=583 RepID=UPI000C00084F|nr:MULTISPECIES: hypothetical protein [Proteus]